jgi:5'-methylthioadenosine phosphorylase
MRVDTAIIGGTGVGTNLLALPGTHLCVPTPYGHLRGKAVEFGGRRIVIASRHSAGHKVPPHKVAYRAIIRGLKQLGVKRCFSTAAVGTLRPDWRIADYAICKDVIDDTARKPTFFDLTVEHTPMAAPFSPLIMGQLADACRTAGKPAYEGAVYVCAQGPRYETPHEIHMYRQWGGDIVGMTAATEAILAVEAGLDYGCLAVVTNLAAGMAVLSPQSDEGIHHEGVTDVMGQEWPTLEKVLAAAVAAG